VYGRVLSTLKLVAVLAVSLAALNSIAGGLSRAVAASSARCADAGGHGGRESSEEALHLAQFSIDQSTVGILWVN
jgi:hypothetical protein